MTRDLHTSTVDAAEAFERHHASDDRDDDRPSPSELDGQPMSGPSGPGPHTCGSATRVTCWRCLAGREADRG